MPSKSKRKQNRAATGTKAVASAAPAGPKTIPLCRHARREEYLPKAAAASAYTVPINQSHPGADRYRMPPLFAGAAGGKQNGQRTMLYNLGKVCSALQRPPEMLGCFLGAALSMPVRPADPSAGVHAYVLGGPAAPEKLDGLLRSFIDDWVLCPGCRLPESGLSVQKHGLQAAAATGGGGGGGEASKRGDAGRGGGRKGGQKTKKKGGGQPPATSDHHGRAAPSIWLTCSACGNHSPISAGVAARQPKLVKLLLAKPDELCQWGAMQRPLAAGATGRRVAEATALADNRRRGGTTTIMQLRTSGAFLSHCRQLGRLLAIDAARDPRASQTQLRGSSVPLSAGLPSELLVQIFVHLDPEPLYRCMQSCVGWHQSAVHAVADQRLQRKERAEAAAEAAAGGSDQLECSSSDQSFTTTESSEEDREEEEEDEEDREEEEDEEDQEEDEEEEEEDDDDDDEEDEEDEEDGSAEEGLVARGAFGGV
eukprot:SAG22_NODE_771_length_7318_cov_6.057487_3_plen_481_part_00